MSIILERIKKVNEFNRRNIHKVLNEYDERVKAEMNGVPMRATWDQDFYMWRDGELKKLQAKAIQLGDVGYGKAGPSVFFSEDRSHCLSW